MYDGKSQLLVKNPLNRYLINSPMLSAMKKNTDDSLTQRTLERSIVRNVKVRGAGGAERRPIVLMKICIGKPVYNEQFSLNDRGEMNYPVLIGRNTIEHLGLVDVTKAFTMEPHCAKDLSSK